MQRGTGDARRGDRQAAGRQDRHHQRQQGRLVRRLLARSGGRRLRRLRPAAQPGRQATGGALAPPIFIDFMQEALKDKPATPFRVPPGIRLVRVDADTGRADQRRATRRHPRGVQAGHRHRPARRRRIAHADGSAAPAPPPATGTGRPLLKPAPRRQARGGALAGAAERRYILARRSTRPHPQHRLAAGDSPCVPEIEAICRSRSRNRPDLLRRHL